MKEELLTAKSYYLAADIYSPYWPASRLISHRNLPPVSEVRSCETSALILHETNCGSRNGIEE